MTCQSSAVSDGKAGQEDAYILFQACWLRMKLILTVGKAHLHFLGKLGAEKGTHSDISISTFGIKTKRAQHYFFHTEVSKLEKLFAAS